MRIGQGRSAVLSATSISAVIASPAHFSQLNILAGTMYLIAQNQ
jgi:hypothetical protein